MTKFQLWVIAGLLLAIPYGLSAQVLTNGGALTIQSGAFLLIQGDLTNEGIGFLRNDGDVELTGTLTNNSTIQLSEGSGVFRLTGTAAQTIAGGNVSRFFDLEINNPNGITLNQSIRIDNQLQMIAGNLDLNGQFITLSESASLAGENDSRRIFGSSGEIQTTRVLNNPTGMNIANLGIELTSSANLGSTDISRGHAVQSIGSGASIARYFDIRPSNNTNLDATMRMYYLPSELNGQNPVYLNFFGLGNGASNWSPAWGNPDLATNSVAQTGIESMLLWTLSDDGTTAMDSRPTLSVSYFPNPLLSGQSLTFVGLAAGKYECLLFDSRGRQVVQKKLTAPGSDSRLEVVLPQLAIGMYTIQLLSADFRPMIGKLMIHAH